VVAAQVGEGQEDRANASVPAFDSRTDRGTSGDSPLNSFRSASFASLSAEMDLQKMTDRDSVMYSRLFLELPGRLVE